MSDMPSGASAVQPTTSQEAVMPGERVSKRIRRAEKAEADRLAKLNTEFDRLVRPYTGYEQLPYNPRYNPRHARRK